MQGLEWNSVVAVVPTVDCLDMFQVHCLMELGRMNNYLKPLKFLRILNLRIGRVLCEQIRDLEFSRISVINVMIYQLINFVRGLRTHYYHQK